MTTQVLLTYALNQKGDLVHIDSVPKGNDCGCICPNCKSRLCAKNGGLKREHHFAHLKGEDCGGGVEFALHKMAKDILLESKCVFLPQRADGRYGGQIHFDSVQVEFIDSETNLRPDCIGYFGEKSLWIEFKWTHPVDEKKAEKIISAKKDCIEINLNNCQLDYEEVKQFITNSVLDRIWIGEVVYINKDRVSEYSVDIIPNLFSHSFVKDSSGKIVNAQGVHIDFEKQTYYCLGCGKELSTSEIIYEKKRLRYLTNCINCTDKTYYKGAAKEIIYDKFFNSETFDIKIPLIRMCDNWSNCKFYSKSNCISKDSKTYDIKEYKYSECYKDFKLTDSDFKYDLIIKRPGTLEGAILLSINESNVPKTLPSAYKLIELKVEGNELKKLIDYTESISAIEDEQTRFCNFKNQQEYTLPDLINRDIRTFELYSTGEYQIEWYACKYIEGPVSGVIYKIIFPEGLDKQENELLKKEIRFSLLKCYKQKRKACFCEICYFFSNSYNEALCKRYKTKGTPRNPLKEVPINCPYFSLNRQLANQLEQEFSNVRLIEKEYTQTDTN